MPNEQKKELKPSKPTKDPEKLLKENLEEKLKGGFHMLKPHHHYKGKFKTELLYLNGYEELFLTVRSLLSLCISTLQYGDFENRSLDRNPKNQVRDVLELIARLFPIEEGELLDELREIIEGEKSD